MVTAVPEGATAVGAAEALGMEVLVKRRDALVEDGLAAAAAARREQLLVAALAVGPPIALEEVARTQLLVAVGAHEMLQRTLKYISFCQTLDFGENAIVMRYIEA